MRKFDHPIAESLDCPIQLLDGDRALEPRDGRIVVVVEAADRPVRRHVAGLSALAGIEHATWLISGQSVCSGCGSDAMLCGRVSLLTNRTWLPRGTTTFFGDTALFAMVIVAAAFGLGELLELLPQAAVARMPD